MIYTGNVFDVLKINDDGYYQHNCKLTNINTIGITKVIIHENKLNNIHKGNNRFKGFFKLPGTNDDDIIIDLYFEICYIPNIQILVQTLNRELRYYNNIITFKVSKINNIKMVLRNGYTFKHDLDSTFFSNGSSMYGTKYNEEEFRGKVYYTPSLLYSWYISFYIIYKNGTRGELLYRYYFGKQNTPTNYITYLCNDELKIDIWDNYGKQLFLNDAITESSLCFLELIIN